MVFVPLIHVLCMRNVLWFCKEIMAWEIIILILFLKLHSFQQMCLSRYISAFPLWISHSNSSIPLIGPVTVISFSPDVASKDVIELLYERYLFVVTLNVNLLLMRQYYHSTVNGSSNTGFGRSNESNTRRE